MCIQFAAVVRHVYRMVKRYNSTPSVIQLENNQAKYKGTDRQSDPRKHSQETHLLSRSGRSSTTTGIQALYSNGVKSVLTQGDSHTARGSNPSKVAQITRRPRQTNKARKRKTHSCSPENPKQ